LTETIAFVDQAAILARLRRAFWIGVAALAAVALTVMLLGWLSQRSLALLVESQTTARLAREARSLAEDRETAIRRYLLSHQQVSLAPEFAARQPLKSKLDSLHLLSAGNASQADRAKTIRASVTRWERGWVLPILDAANKGTLTASDETLAGKELYDGIRSAFDSFVSGQQRISVMRLRVVRFLQRASLVLIMLEISVLLGIMGWLARRGYSQTATLFEQHGKLEAQSLDLQEQAAVLEEQAAELEEQADEANRTVAILAATNENLEATIKRLEAAESNANHAIARHGEAESLLEVLMQNSPVGIALYDRDRRAVRINATMQGMTDVTNSHVIGSPGRELEGDDVAESMNSLLDRVIADEETFLNVPLGGFNRSDLTNQRYFLGSFFPVPLVPGKRGAGAVVLETTQYRQLEEQLLQSQKMEAVGRLAGGVAHDFNNMLTAILSYSELLLTDMPPDSPQRADMSEILKAAQKATTLTRKLLAFSRQQVLRPIRVDLNSTIDGLTRMMRRLLGPDIRLSLRLAPSLWTVSADQAELERVIMNLILNARDAMGEGGKLVIETSNITLDSEYASSHAETKPGPYVVLVVSDTGAGMTREVREKLFEPFFTTKERGKGTGLGLPSVYGIVKQSGGFIWVYSEPGKGTTFKVYLPRAEDVSTDAAIAPAQSRSVGSETILLVEDDEEVRQVATRILRRNGYRVLEAGNGADALRVCENEPDPVDLIVTDIIMPEMGGTELAARIREKQPAARILFTSGYTEDAVVRQSFLHPGEAFIEKPFTPELLARKARELLRPHDGDES
jgi:signal transduction histidine kinase/CHASE3 domain sensor protein